MSDKYAIMHIEKIKSAGALVARYNHDYRIADVKNADKSKEDQNEVLVAIQRGANYYEAQQARVHDNDYYKTHDIRKNAVLAYDIVLSYSNNSNVNVDEWKQASVKWLEDTFNKAGDGKSNLVSVVLHMDEIHGEPGDIEEGSHNSPHIHAIVVPIDDKNKLNASYYTNGSRALSNLQDTYAQAMQEFDLQRGTRNSSARHEPMQKMYGRFEEAMKNIPQPEPEETAKEFYDRAVDDLQTAHVRSVRNVDDYFRDMQRKNDVSIQQQMDEVDLHFEQKEKEFSIKQNHVEKILKEKEKEIERKQSGLKRKMKEAEDRTDELKKQYAELQTQLEEIRSRLTAIQNMPEETAEEMAEDVLYMDRIRAGLESIQQKDPQVAEDYAGIIEQVQNEGQRVREAEMKEQDEEI